MTKEATEQQEAEFIRLPNYIKSKVGTGGLSESILNKAQQLLEEHSIDFTPQALELLDELEQALQSSKTESEENHIREILDPIVQFHSHASMFHFPLVKEISTHIIAFLKSLDHLDKEALEILMAYHTTVKAIILSKIYGDGGERGKELLHSLIDACERYYKLKNITPAKPD